MQMEDLVKRMGEGMMTGGSPTSLRTQALATLDTFLHTNSRDPWACLNPILLRWAEQDESLALNYANPLVALKHTVAGILERKESLYEFVRQVDVQYAQTHQEKPIFQQPGDTPHPDDEYTHESVEKDLQALLEKL